MFLQCKQCEKVDQQDNSISELYNVGPKSSYNFHFIVFPPPLCYYRHLFERVIHLSLSAKKIKFFFKRYLDFEKKYGDETSINAVKQKAVEYVESKTAVGDDL